MTKRETQRLVRLSKQEQALRHRGERIRAQMDILLLSTRQINEELEAIRAAQDALVSQMTKSA